MGLLIAKKEHSHLIERGREREGEREMLPMLVLAVALGSMKVVELLEGIL